MAETVNVMKCGDIITHAYHGGENNCTENNFDALKLAKEKGIIVDTGFAGYVHTDFSVFKEAIKAGYYPDTISSDITKHSAFKRGGKYGLTMCMSMARTAGLSEEAVFKCVTSSAAKVLNKEGEWGVLKEGNIADIAVFSFSYEGFSLTDFSGNVFENKLGYRCELTIIDGEVVYRN
jgi:predicted amidohydrolase